MEILLLPKEYFFYKIEKIYYSRIIFNGQNCIIGTPFFYLFHTMFDKEERMLRFYPKNLEHIEKREEKEGALVIPIEFINMQNTDDKNRLLVAKVKIGTPSKEFKLLLDSTSNMTWVASKGSNDEFPINNHYESDLSTTDEKINKQFTILL